MLPLILKSPLYAVTFLKYRHATMVRPVAYLANLYLTETALRSLHSPLGAVVECGTWRGGMAAGLIEIGGPHRPYHFFDSFAGLPPPEDEDGEEARRWRSNVTGPRYFNNCTASIDEFISTVRRTNISPDSLHIYPGFFDQTFLHVARFPIAVLRLDADWYRSTTQCLEKFWDWVVTGGTIIIDDYHDWEGCRKAVHEFLSKRRSREEICQTPIGQVVYIRKSVA
jgi:O-methyltransferase